MGRDESNRCHYSPSEIVGLFPYLPRVGPRKLENAKALLSLQLAWYNFSRVHSTARMPPMAAGIADSVWNIGSLLIN